MLIENDDARVAVGAPPSKRGGIAQALERRITWESLLLGGMVVAYVFLGAIAMLEVASFAARFVARAVSTELLRVRPVRVRLIDLARPDHDAPPSVA